jgi:OOP family OmpA-OmpF porin
LSVVVPFGASTVSRKASATAPYQPVAYVAPAAPVTTAAAAPSVKVEAAPSAPMAAFAPATPTPLRVSFTAESLFGFDSSVIRLEGKSALDKFARDVAGTQFQVVVVEGHADRIGTENYNQALSLRRAEAVKAYLVSPGGMDESKISTRGLGEDSPSQAGECLASLPTAQLRACLQPDRRVDVDVNGQR